MADTRRSVVKSASFRRLVKATAIGFGVVVLGTASLGQVSAQNTDIFGDDWPFPVVGERPVPGVSTGSVGGSINVGGNSGGSVIMGGGSGGGISIGGGSSSSGGGGGSGNSAGYP